MRKFSRLSKSRGFTLVELMIVVAIIGVLAALAIYGVRKYLATAKTAEAKNTLGAISRGSVAAYERENMGSQIITAGGTSTASSHSLCGSSTPVPVAVPANKKYQPSSADYNKVTATNDSQNGWICLKFVLSEPQYYQYAYSGNKDNTASAAQITTDITTAGAMWFSEAKGDLDGNGVFSEFQLTGALVNSQPITATTVAEYQADE